MDIPTSLQSTLPVVVVGAGVAGLACATKLTEEGCNVVLIEATSHGGGRARSYFDPKIGATIDNGQHLFMGCYLETLRFLRRVGSENELKLQSDLEVHLARPDAPKRLRLRCPTLPAPMHLAAGLMKMRGLSVQDRLSVLRLGMVINQELQRPDDDESCDAWLQRMGQSPGLRRTFWDPLIWGTLNEDPLASSAAMLLAVVKRGFVSTQRASCFGVSRVGLSELYVKPSLEYLQKQGAIIHLGAPAKQISPLSAQGITVTLKNGREIHARQVVLAVPPSAVPKLFESPWRHLPAIQSIQSLEHAPIVNLWARLDGPLKLKTDFIGLLESPLHWIFDRGRIEKTVASENLISVTISGARASVQDDAPQLQELLQAELFRFFGRQAPKITAFRAIKEHRATIRHAVGSYRQRPECDIEIPGVYLAGDWVRTGLPATIEGAAQSGHEAARLVLHQSCGHHQSAATKR